MYGLCGLKLFVCGSLFVKNFIRKMGKRDRMVPFEGFVDGFKRLFLVGLDFGPFDLFTDVADEAEARIFVTIDI